MQTIGKPVAAPRRTSKPIIGSATVHLLVLAAIIHRSAPAQSATTNPKTQPKLVDSKSPMPTLPAKRTKPTTASPNTNSPVSTQPDSATGADALGSGNIDIALA